MASIKWKKRQTFSSLLPLLYFGKGYTKKDPLPSWNEGEVKNSILQFIKEITNKNGPNYIAPAKRIATFDQDGTLMPEHPEWKNEEPFKSILANHLEAFSLLKRDDITRIVIATHTGMTVDQLHDIDINWLETSLHPRYKKRFTELAYQPMLEVIQLFQSHGFKNYMVSGAGQEFMRASSEKVFGIPPEHIIGSTVLVRYDYNNGQPVLIKTSKVLIADDGPGKPENINLFIGRRPVAAFGNSDGDQQMLEWTHGGQGKSLALLVHHDDHDREYTYGDEAFIGRFSDALMNQATRNNWLIASMKKDWKILFHWEKQTEHVKKDGNGST
jgi:hypothetical protein